MCLSARLFQDVNAAKSLGEELIRLAKGSTEAKSGQLIIDSVADIVRLQGVCVAN